MSDWTKMLRLLVQGDKEAKISVVTSHGDPAQFTSQLESDHMRKSISVYNNSDSASGECFYGFSSTISPSGESTPIPQGAQIDIPVADVDAIGLYHCCVSGELGDLRFEEIA